MDKGKDKDKHQMKGITVEVWKQIKTWAIYQIDSIMVWYEIQFILAMIQV